MKYEVNWSQYLESICTDEKYLSWQDFYTPTDALHRQRIEKKQPPRRLNLSLMVKIIPSLEEVEEEEKVKWLEVLAELRKYADNHVLLVGKPGSGKSTALERLLWEEAEKARTQPEEKIPVLVELRRYKTSVLEIIGNFLFQHQCSLNEAEIEKLLLAGKFLLLVDGWNELPDEEARKEVKKFREKYQRLTPMIFTTRELAGDIGIQKKLEIQRLTEAQMRQFVLTYLPEEGERLLKKLQGRLRELGETPLLLWMLCELFKITGNIPPNLGLVFRCFAQSYDSQIKQNVSTDESPSRWFLLLQHLAFEMMRGENATNLRVAIPKQEGEDILTEFLAAKKFVKPRECAFNWLNDLLKYHLIQLTNSNQEIEFHHQLLQEYYAAERLLVQLPKLSDDTLKRDYLNYLKWTEPLALMLALVEDEEQALRVVKLALEVDLQLGARLAGEVKLEFQEKTVDLVVKLEITAVLKVKFLGLTRFEKAVSVLVPVLNHKDSQVCETAIKALVNIRNKSAIDALVATLNIENITAFRRVVEGLVNIGNEEVIAVLAAALNQENYQFTYLAIYILGKIGNEQAIPALIKALNHENDRVRMMGAFGLGKIGNEQAVPALVAALNDENSQVRNTAVEALGKIGNEQATVVLIEAACNHKYSDVCHDAPFALATISNEQATPLLVVALNHEHFQVRCYAAVALRRIGNEQAVLALVAALNNKYSDVRIDAAIQLQYIGNEQAVPALVTALNDEDSGIRSWVAGTLGVIGNEQAVPALIKALNDEDKSVRYEAASALGKIGNEQAVPALIKALNDEDKSVRMYAGLALGKMGNEQGIPALVMKLIYDDFLNDYESAVEALIKIGEQAVDALVPALNHKDSLVRMKAAKALGKSDNQRAVPALVAALNDRSDDVYFSAALALAKIGNEQAVPALIKAFNALNDQTFFLVYFNESHAYSLVVEALEKIGNEQVTVALVAALNHQEYYVPWRAAEALGNIGNEQATAGLFQALNDEKSDVCKSAAKALGKIGSPEFLPRLTSYLKTNIAIEVLKEITRIQKRCQYYNYEIYNYPR